MKLWSWSKGTYEKRIHGEQKMLDEPDLLVWYLPQEEHSRRGGRWLLCSRKIKKGSPQLLWQSSQLLLLKLTTWLPLALVILIPKKGKTIPNRAHFPGTRKIFLYMKSMTILCYSQTIFKAYSVFLSNISVCSSHERKWYSYRQCCCAVLILPALGMSYKSLKIIERATESWNILKKVTEENNKIILHCLFHIWLRCVLHGSCRRADVPLLRTLPFSQNLLELGYYSEHPLQSKASSGISAAMALVFP